MSLPRTSHEGVDERVAKRQRTEARANVTESSRWLDVDEKNEAFVMRMRPLEHQWGRIFMPHRKHGLLDIWKKFITPSIMAKLMDTFMAGNNAVGSRKSKGGGTTKFVKHLIIDDTKLVQAFAVYIYICTEGKKASEVRKSGRCKHDQIKKTVEHLKSKHPNASEKKLCGTASIEIIISRVLLTQDYAAELSENFRSILNSVGQNAAGDEKIFHFTGDSSLVRMVPRNPRKAGLCFYQLACKLNVGNKELPYMMDILLHDDTSGTTHVVDVVKRWAAAIEEVETQSTIVENRNEARSAWLIFNSNDTTSRDREYLIDKKQKFIGSVKPDRFIVESTKIHRVNVADKIGEWRSIYNPGTNEVFTYHYDIQKGVGKKYCIAHGLEQTVEKQTVDVFSGQIPAYSYYKNMLEVCDNFNRALHNRAWPHTRGGAGVPGDIGSHHDFFMAVVMQNIRNAWLALNNTDPSSVTFEKSMKDLAYDLYSYSLDI